MPKLREILIFIYDHSKDESFLAAMKENPVNALEGAGLELTNGQKEWLLDTDNDTVNELIAFEKWVSKSGWD